MKHFFLLALIGLFTLGLTSCFETGPSKEEREVNAEEEARIREERERKEKLEQEKRAKELLFESGKSYVLNQLKSPSTAVFQSYIDADKFRKHLKDNFDISYPSNCEITVLEVEATNGFGGRDRVNYVVFYKDGNPIGVSELELGTTALRQAITWYFNN